MIIIVMTMKVPYQRGVCEEHDALGISGGGRLGGELNRYSAWGERLLPMYLP